MLNANDEIILDHISKLQHGFDFVLQDNLHLMTDAGRDTARWQITLMENKMFTLRYLLNEIAGGKYDGLRIVEQRRCPACNHDVVWGLYRNGVWSCTCDRCGKVETTTDRATAERLWVVVGERESGIVDSETKGPEPETTGAGSETEV